MEPSKKSEEMEQALTGLFGFDRRSLIEANRCAPPPIGCGGEAREFKDGLSRREYAISGLCQTCQDRIFDSEDGGGECNDLALEPPPTPRSPPLVAGPNDIELRWFIPHDQREHIYRKYVGKSGRTWLVAIQEAAAEDIYVTNNSANTTSREQGFEGFGGSTLRFKVDDGSIFEAHGPWHTNADALFTDTGVDVRNTYRTFVVLSKGRDCQWPQTIMRDVVYKDEAPVVGSFYRYMELIALYPEANYYYNESSGGNSSGSINREVKA